MSKWIVMAAVLAAGALAPAQAGKFQCWTDDKGVRMCGDRVPPEYAKQERTVVDSQGRVIDTKERQKTDDEIKAEEAAKKLAEEMALRKRQQAEYDRFLLETYTTEREMIKARDERIATLDSRLKLTDQSIADNQETLKKLKARAAAAEKNKVPVDKKLAKQLDEFEKSLAQNQAAAAQLQQDRESTRKKFEDDIARWRELKSGG